MTKALVTILGAVRLIRDKLLGIERRLKANEAATKTMRVLVSQVRTNLRAQLAAPGSPMLRHLLDFYGKIVSRDESDPDNRTWFVRRQVISGAGEVTDDADYPENISARTWQETTYEADDIVLVRWDGMDGAAECYSIVPLNNAPTSGKQFKITAIGNNTLTCHPYDGVTEGTETVIVAKNPDVRHISSMLGITYSYTGSDARTATQGGDTENQIVTPPYWVGALITAVPCRVKIDDAWLEWVEVTGREYAKVQPEE